MIVEQPLKGTFCSLRSVESEDAEFILSIRNDPKISEFLPVLDVSVADQQKWIEKQRNDSESYYFLIEDKEGKQLGTISVYDIKDDHAETGRFCSYGDFIQNTEAVLLLYDFIFYELNLKYATTWVYTENKAVVSMNTQTGFKWNEITEAEDGRECCVGCLVPSDYEKKMSPIRRKLGEKKG